MARRRDEREWAEVNASMVPSEIVRWWLRTAESPNLQITEMPNLRITGHLSHRTYEAPKVVRKAPEIVLRQATGLKVMWASSRGCEVARGCWASEVWVATRRYWDAYGGTGRNVGASLWAVQSKHVKGGVPLTMLLNSVVVNSGKFTNESKGQLHQKRVNLLVTGLAARRPYCFILYTRHYSSLVADDPRKHVQEAFEKLYYGERRQYLHRVCCFAAKRDPPHKWPTGVWGSCMCVCSSWGGATTWFGDLQKGERYANVDYVLLSALGGVGVERLVLLYDIACQWKVDLLERAKATVEKTDFSTRLKDFEIQFGLPVWHEDPR
ncbi:hypothetical protein GGX14DRAFT_406795 [Mycena pura]|uniref:Uncharacterized protein n=1 Tax=Mycena pura TaxID=153505 RepID=A0AAD6UPU8_9AGAR|nr:hypothetical protein GGX14DRAFT_406795 [Mycena pura]